MDEQDLDLDFEDLTGEANECDTETFYWALKSALERTPTEAPPAPAQ